VKPKLHIQRECGLRFHPLRHTSYIRLLVKISSQGIMSSKEANNNPGLCPIKGQKSGLCTCTRAQNQFSSLSLSTTKTLSPCQILVIYQAFYLSSYILPRNPQKRLRSNKPLNRTVSWELVGDFTSSHSGMPRDPIQSHSVPPVPYHSTNAPPSSSPTRCSYQKDKGAKYEKLLKNTALSEIWKRWIDECFHCFVFFL
jgi:hypothetical protein